MNKVKIIPGMTGNIGAKQVKGNLKITGAAVQYTIQIGTAGTTAHKVPIGKVNTHAINNKKVVIMNQSTLSSPAGDLVVTY